jgi:hypothetical protein
MSLLYTVLVPCVCLCQIYYTRQTATLSSARQGYELQQGLGEEGKKWPLVSLCKRSLGSQSEENKRDFNGAL